MFSSLSAGGLSELLLNSYLDRNPDLSPIEKAKLFKDFPLTLCVDAPSATLDGLLKERTLFPACIYVVEAKKTSRKPYEKLVLCSSALRCISLIKDISSKTGDKPLKLFAKHLKIEDQIQQLKQGRGFYAVGTPGRVLALYDRDPKVFAGLKQIVLDMDRDSKTRCLLDMSETRDPLLEFLFGRLLKNGQQVHVKFCG